MNITVKTVSNEEIKARKGFGGADWWWDESGNLEVRIASEMEDWKEAMSLAVHEVIEALICKHMEVTIDSVDEFDSKYVEEEKDPSFNSGDQTDAPYKVPHTYATAVERILTGVFGVDWKRYDENLSKL